MNSFNTVLNQFAIAELILVLGFVVVVLTNSVYKRWRDKRKFNKMIKDGIEEVMKISRGEKIPARQTEYLLQQDGGMIVRTTTPEGVSEESYTAHEWAETQKALLYRARK